LLYSFFFHDKFVLMKREGRTFREVPKPSPKVFGSTLGFMLLGLDKQTSANSKAKHQFRLDQHL
jgi:hypothetical protein